MSDKETRLQSVKDALTQWFAWAGGPRWPTAPVVTGKGKSISSIVDDIVSVVRDVVAQEIRRNDAAYQSVVAPDEMPLMGEAAKAKVTCVVCGDSSRPCHKCRKWECFCDESYHGMWAVREVGEKRWGCCFHLNSHAEAVALRDILSARQ